MRLASIQEGDRVLVDVLGQVFSATVAKVIPSRRTPEDSSRALVKIEDTRPRVGRVFVSPRQVKRKLESGAAR